MSINTPGTPGEDEQETADRSGEDELAGDDLAAVKEQAEQYYRNWQRAAADLQNYKRRTEDERGESARLQKATLIINILPVFDDFERAVESVDAKLAGLNWVQGVVAIHRKFAQLLEAMDVHPIHAEGQPFDPASHEAVGQQPGKEGEVVAVVQRGYRLGDRVVRPAMVMVGSGEAASETAADGVS